MCAAVITKAYNWTLTCIIVGLNFRKYALDQAHVVVALFAAGTALDFGNLQLIILVISSKDLTNCLNIFTEFIPFSIYGLKHAWNEREKIYVWLRQSRC